MTRDQADQLGVALREEFGGDVEVMPEAEAGRYQFSVLSPGFRGVPTLKRQDAVWSTVDRVLPRDDTFDVAMVWTFAPGEMEEWIEGLSK